MRTKRGRKPDENTSRNKRRQLGPSSPEPRATTPDAHDENGQGAIAPEAPATQSGVSSSWADLVAANDIASLASQIQRYKDWRRNGSARDSHCCVCHQQTGTLEPCHTCRLVFHVDCIPNRSSKDPLKYGLFCSICVRRGWHVSPPALTPPASPEPTPQPTTTTATAPTSNIPNLVADTATTDLQPPSRQAPRRARKSRYATLPDEVESSLAVLYCELESIAPLKQKVEELENKNTQHLQTIRIRDNSLDALRRQLAQQQAARDELERLRDSYREYGDMRSELDGLRARNSVLEAELRDAKEEAVKAQELVESWKGKLSVLLES